MIGKIIDGYEIEEKIGQGGMADVYRAKDRNVTRSVALKVLKPEYASDYEFRTRFEREANAVASLEHLHILPLFAYGAEEDTQLYLVMRYMPQGSLLAYIEKQGPLDFQEASRMIKQLASALDYAHTKGIMHRDLKPGNILLDDLANVYLTDFGLAKWVGSSKTLTGEFIVGTPHYMAPEQCRGHEVVPATDQYSLAVVLYYMLTGSLLFDADKPIYVMRDHVMTPPPSPREHRPDIPEAAEKVILMALAKEPEGRFPSCMAFANAFDFSISDWKPRRSQQPQKPKSTRDSSFGLFPPIED